MAVLICAGVFDLRLDRKQPATWSRSALGKRPAARSRIPSPVSSTVNSVPGAQAREVRMFLGRMIWPLVESRVVFMGKTPVGLLARLMKSKHRSCNRRDHEDSAGDHGRARDARDNDAPGSDFLEQDKARHGGDPDKVHH